jgi:hypothetical protein
VKLISQSDHYKAMQKKPAIDCSAAMSVADAVRFLNGVYSTNFAASVWRIIINYAVPTAVVNKLFHNKKKKEH